MATDLKAPCPHGRYDEHSAWTKVGYQDYRELNPCPGGTLLPPDSLLIVKEDGELVKVVAFALWAEAIADKQLARDRWDGTFKERPLKEQLKAVYLRRAVAVLDALAAAQPGDTSG